MSGIEEKATMGTKQSNSQKISRRKILKKIKKSTVFVVPTLVSFNISKLHANSTAPAAIPPPPSEW